MTVNMRTLDDYLASFEAISDEGGIVVLKLDGLREVNRYTVVLSGGRLKDDFFRKDGCDLLLLCDEALKFYDSVATKLR